MQSDNEDEIDELMNDCDTEFIPPEEIELTWNPDNARDLTLEANAHLVDQGATHTKELETKKEKKSEKKMPWPHGNATVLHILERIFFLMAELPISLTQVLQLSIPDVLIEIT